MKQLRTDLSALAETLEAVPWENRRVYAAFLAQTHHYSRHTTRILARACSLFPMEQAEEHNRLLSFASRETVQEKRIEQDLRSLGFSLSDFPESPSTRAFYLANYGSIDSEGPWSVFGYVLALETLSLEKASWLHERVKKHHGEKAASFLRAQGTPSLASAEATNKVFEAIPEKEKPAVRRHLATAIFLYGAILAQLGGVKPAVSETTGNPSSIDLKRFGVEERKLGLGK